MATEVLSGLGSTVSATAKFLNIGLIAIPCFLFILYIFLVWRKRNRLRIPAVEVRNLGKGKFSLKFFKAGVFGHLVYLKMLFWKGDRTIRLSDTTVIQGMQDDFFQEVNGKRGIVFYRDPKNNHIGIPLSKAEFENTELLMQLAPVNVKNTILDNLRAARRETQPHNSQTIQMIGIAVICLVIMVSVIFVTNYGGKVLADGQKYMLDSQNAAAATCKNIAVAACSEAIRESRGGTSTAP